MLFGDTWVNINVCNISWFPFVNSAYALTYFVTFQQAFRKLYHWRPSPWGKWEAGVGEKQAAKELILYYSNFKTYYVFLSVNMYTVPIPHTRVNYWYICTISDKFRFVLKQHYAFKEERRGCGTGIVSYVMQGVLLSCKHYIKMFIW